MSTTENKANARRIPLEAFNTGNPAVFDEVVVADVVDHLPPPGLPPGRESYKQFVLMLRAAFPDFQYTLDDEIAEKDRIVHRITARGTHKGEFLGIPPTGKHVTWSEIHILSMVDGKAVEHWGNVDQLGLLQQLGVIPAGAGAGVAQAS